MAKAFGVVTFTKSSVWVEGLQDHRPIGAISFMGRYRVIDFPISNMTNSGIDQIQVYIKRKPRSLAEHIGTGRHYNINSKRGRLHMLFSDVRGDHDIYNNDIAAFKTNLEFIESRKEEYVVIAPGYMVYTQDYSKLIDQHIASEADITMLYHRVDNAKTAYKSDDVLEMNRQKGVNAIIKNPGNKDKRNIFMDTYVMKKTLFIDLIESASKISSLFSLVDIINERIQEDEELDVRGVQHKGFFAPITDFKSYFHAHTALLDFDTAKSLIDDNWPIYTRTNDSVPTQYFETASVKRSIVSNGCLIEGEIENSVIGRACKIDKGAVIKNCIILPEAWIGEGVHLENVVVDRAAQITRIKEIIADESAPEYIKRHDRI